MNHSSRFLTVAWSLAWLCAAFWTFLGCYWIRMPVALPVLIGLVMVVTGFPMMIGLGYMAKRSDAIETSWGLPFAVGVFMVGAVLSYLA